MWYYAAFGIIAQIDNMYAMSLKRFPLKAALDSPPVMIKGGLTKEYSPMLKIGYAINKIQTFFYANFYYYFMAYGVIAVTGILGVPQTA